MELLFLPVTLKIIAVQIGAGLPGSCQGVKTRVQHPAASLKRLSHETGVKKGQRTLSETWTKIVSSCLGLTTLGDAECP